MFLKLFGCIPKLKSRGEGKIQNGIYAYQEQNDLEGTPGMHYIEETIRDGHCTIAQGWWEPIQMIEHKKLINYKPIE
jgi:hypothetical protein